MTDRAVDVSVIIPAYRADDTIGRCLAALLAQDFRGTYEVIVVSSADGPDRHPLVPDDPRLRVVRVDDRVAAAAARNRACELASGDFLAFTDADAFVDGAWIRRLVEASKGGTFAVGGGVVNGTPRSVFGSIEYLLEFSDQHPRRPPASAWHAATVNLMLPRPLWLKYGPWPEDMGGGEDTWISLQLKADGSFVFRGDALVTHLNRTSLRDVVRRQHMQGRHAAHIARRAPHPFGALLRYPALAPVAMLARVATALRRIIGWAPELWRTIVPGAPVLLLALGAWAAGLVSEGLRLRDGRRSR